jgi:flagellin
MALDSVNTNMGAMVALSSLNATEAQLASTQKQISTGYRVADSTDDGAAYAIALGIRSTVGSLTTANQQLGNVQGLLSVTQTGLNNIATTMASMRDVLVNLSNGSLAPVTKTQYENQYNQLLGQVRSYIQDAGYEGKTLIGDVKGTEAGAVLGNAIVTRNDMGATYGIYTMSGSVIYSGITNATSLGSASFVANTLLGSSARGFSHFQTLVGTDLATIGSNVNYVNNQITYNNDKIDALNSGLGSLVDANLAQESAQLTALQIRQQLGTQALSLANQAPQTLLSLFK